MSGLHAKRIGKQIPILLECFYFEWFKIDVYVEGSSVHSIQWKVFDVRETSAFRLGVGCVLHGLWVGACYILGITPMVQSSYFKWLRYDRIQIEPFGRRVT